MNFKEILKPREGEYSENYRRYINLVQHADIFNLLYDQIAALKHFFEGITENQVMESYSQGKWSYKEVLGHLIDTEKIMQA